MIPDTNRGEGRAVMDRDQINKRLEQAAVGGAAARSQMIDRVVNDEAGGARAAFSQELTRDREQLRAWDRVASNFSALDAVALEVEFTAKWNGLDAGLVRAVTDTAAHARRELPTTIHTAREAIDASATRSEVSDAVTAPDDPAASMNRVLRRALTTDLDHRMRASFVSGYAERLNTGNEWLQAGQAGRTVMEANTLAARVEAYSALDRINEAAASELDFDDHLRDPDAFAQRFVSGQLDAALVDAAHIAGRWSGTDPVIDHHLDVLTSRTAAVDAAPQVTDPDMREVRYHFADQTLRGGEAGLVGMTRAQTERAAEVLRSSVGATADNLDAVRNVLQTQPRVGRAAGGADDRRYEPPTAGPSNGLER